MHILINVVLCLFYSSHPSVCEVVSHCGFDLYFLFFKKIFIYLLIFGCVGSSFLCEGFL